VTTGFTQQGPRSQPLIGGGDVTGRFQELGIGFRIFRRILIQDTKTLVPLWGFTERAGWAVVKGKRGTSMTPSPELSRM
jgi:hypothetical protein